jgi:hypothetical protein
VGDHGGISPTKLPKHGSAPITARIIGEVSTRDGSHPPALQDLEADIDRTIEVDAVGLPTCKEKQLQATSSAAARKACGDAIVGSGDEGESRVQRHQARFHPRLHLHSAGSTEGSPRYLPCTNFRRKTQ